MAAKTIPPPQSHKILTPPPEGPHRPETSAKDVLEPGFSHAATLSSASTKIASPETESLWASDQTQQQAKMSPVPKSLSKNQLAQLQQYPPIYRQGKRQEPLFELQKAQPGAPRKREAKAALKSSHLGCDLSISDSSSFLDDSDAEE